MAPMEFEEFGALEWLDPAEFWSGDWRTVAKVGVFDVVINAKCTEYRYTSI